MSCVDGQSAGIVGAGYAIGGLFGVTNFVKNPVSDSTVTDLKQQISDNAKELQEKIEEARQKSTDDKFKEADFQLKKYQASEDLVTTLLEEEIEVSNILIYGLIVSVFIIYMYILFKT